MEGKKVFSATVKSINTIRAQRERGEEVSPAHLATLQHSIEDIAALVDILGYEDLARSLQEAAQPEKLVDTYAVDTLAARVVFAQRVLQNWCFSED